MLQEIRTGLMDETIGQSMVRWAGHGGDRITRPESGSNKRRDYHSWRYRWLDDENPDQRS